MEDIQINDILYITEKAGEIIMKIYNENKYNIELKNDKSPVTIADLQSSDYICSELKNLCKDTPIICEETKQIDYDERKNYKYFWLVDPLDGTKEFINKNGQFTVNIALLKNNKPILGVVGIPTQKKIYYAEIGKGSYLKYNNEISKISCKKIDYSNKVKIVCSNSHFNHDTKDYLNKLSYSYDLLRFGSSLKFLKVAEGEADIYPRLEGTKEWDTAASHIIVDEAGGKILLSNDNNSTLKYNKESLKNPYFIVYGKIN